MGALFTAFHLGCKAIVALTESGSTALYRNVRPILLEADGDRDDALAVPRVLGY